MELSGHKICLTKDHQLVLDRVSCGFTQGLYCLAGPNGSGKSSLLAILAGVIESDYGEVLLDQSSITVLSEEYRSQLGFLPQEFGVMPTMTVFGFLKYFAGLKGLSRSYAKKRITELLGQFDLTAHQNKKVVKLSTGERQCLGIIQALLNRPKILILDEPFNYLDINKRLKFRMLLKQLSRETIIIYSTHLIAEASEADEVLFLKHGELLLQRNTSDLLKEFTGKLWELPTSFTDQLDLSEIRLLQIHDSKMGQTQRLFSTKQPLPQARLIKPTMEDIYFFYMEGHHGTNLSRTNQRI